MSCNDPAALLIDEPTSALDYERGAAVVELITTLTHRTHDRSHLDGVDQVVEIVDGSLSRQDRKR